MNVAETGSTTLFWFYTNVRRNTECIRASGRASEQRRRGGPLRGEWRPLSSAVKPTTYQRGR
jgi:hypothetical protein